MRNLCTHKQKASLEPEEFNYKGNPNTAQRSEMISENLQCWKAGAIRASLQVLI